MTQEITREMTFTYMGETVTFSPSMRVVSALNRCCKENMTTLVDLANSVAQKRPDIFTLAYALQALLAASGRTVSESECYRWASSGAYNSPQEMASFLAALLNTIFPEVDAGKKPVGQPRTNARKTTGKKKKGPASST